MATTTIRTPVCFICHRAAQITVSTIAAAALRAGALVQDVLPEMPRPIREQLITGTRPACWTAAFGHDPADPKTSTGEQGPA